MNDLADNIMVYKISTATAWAEAATTGRFCGSADDVRDGYIHLSAVHQVEATAAKYFADRPGLVLVAFRSDELGVALKWEPSRGGQLFPHYYGELPTAAAKWVRKLPLAATGMPCVTEVMSADLRETR
jgi:uncharacterized protein (DUF952 family)